MNLITSSLFLTGTASNPMCQKFAKNMGIWMGVGGGWWKVIGIW